MTEAKVTIRKNIYVAIRARCRSAGIHMDSAAAVIEAFHACNLFTLADVTAALRAEAVKGGTKSSKEVKGEKKETKETKGDSKSSSSPAVQNLVDKILKQLPKGAKSIPAFEDDRCGELPSLTSIVRRIVSGG